MAGTDATGRTVSIPSGDVVLSGDLTVPPRARAAVVFAHGSGSSRHSPRNRAVAERLVDAGFATLLMDLLTGAEEDEDRRTRALRFDIGLLAARVVDALDWLSGQQATAALPIAVFGASTGAAAALRAAAERPDRVRLVISRGGRPDLAGDASSRVVAPTLLIVGGHDPEVLRLNQEAAAGLPGEVHVRVVPGASHLFSEPGALDEVTDMALEALGEYLGA